jgi:uncharacterized repeat protein (TIGR01451 family)
LRVGWWVMALVAITLALQAEHAVAGVPLALQERFDGAVDYVVTGGSLRTANNTVDPCAVTTTSSKPLTGIPANANIRAAYLYWAGSGPTPDNQVTLDGASHTAVRSYTEQFSTGNINVEFFAGIADVTAEVTAKGNGTYTFSDLTVVTTDQPNGAIYCSVQTVLAGWSLIVIYDAPGLPNNSLVLFDGFEAIFQTDRDFALSGVLASDTPTGKTTALVWEGDTTLGGVREQLRYNNNPLSDGLNPVFNAYNSTVNTLPSSSEWGLDLDSYDISSFINPGDTSGTTTVNAGPDLVLLNAVLLQITTTAITGRVFEDVNYGGGSGRNFNAAATAAPGFPAGRPGVRVELYDSAGSFLDSTTTDADGNYGFYRLLNADYYVRVVTDMVTSSRPGGSTCATCLAVQTYRTDGSTGVTVPVIDEVGGANPVQPDAPANTSGANLFTLSAHSVFQGRISGAGIPSADFGYNFDTIVNTNDAGQGSLRQFIDNSNALDNGGLDQDDNPAGATSVPKAAGVEHSLFMIPQTDPGYGASPDGGSGNAFTVTLSSGRLPAITDASTAVDGRTQSAYTGDSNGRVDETPGGGVGNPSSGPEIVVDGNGAIGANPVLESVAANTLFVGLGVTGAVGGSERAVGIRLDSGSSGSSIVDTTAWGNGSDGFMVRNTSDVTIRDSVALANGINHRNADGIWAQNTSGLQILDNTLAGNVGMGIDLRDGNSGYVIQGNLIEGNGATVAGRTGNNQSGVGVRRSPNGVISNNVIAGNTDDGVLIYNNATSVGVRVTQNSIFANGQEGIDLGGGQNGGNGVTLNDLNDADNGPNTLFNYPVVETAQVSGGNLLLRGFARPGTTIELFLADPDPSGFGEGQTYLTTAVEGSGADGDSGTGSYGGPVNGIDQGTDDTSRFEFQIPLSALPGVVAGVQLTATGTDGAGNTSEFSGLVQVVGGIDVSGTVWSDANHDGVRDNGEAGIGGVTVVLYDANNDSCASTQSAADGSYLFSAVGDGSYEIIEAAAESLPVSCPPAPAPSDPTGHISTTANTRPVTVAGVAVIDQDFGDFNGSRISGQVFEDNGTGGGTAHDGLIEGSEPGTAGRTVTILDAGGTTLDSATTDAGGLYTLWVPAGAGPVTVAKTTGAGSVAVSKQPNGVTDSAAASDYEQIAFTPTDGVLYPGLDFGEVREPALAPDHTRTALPGTVVSYAHTLTPATAGSVTFLVGAETATPTLPGWSTVLYLDSDCSGTLDAGEPVHSAPVATAAGVDVCLIARVNIPSNAPVGGQYQVRIDALFEYTGSSAPDTLRSRTDLTIAGEPTASGLELLKSVDKPQALPGEVLTYTINYRNVSTEPLTELVVDDTTPAFTTYLSAVCGTTPGGIACPNPPTVAPAVGSVGNIRWVLVGSLLPGGEGTVQFSVQVDN